MLAIF
jgi:hypothetical protein